MGDSDAEESMGDSDAGEGPPSATSSTEHSWPADESDIAAGTSGAASKAAGSSTPSSAGSSAGGSIVNNTAGTTPESSWLSLHEWDAPRCLAAFKQLVKSAECQESLRADIQRRISAGRGATACNAACTRQAQAIPAAQCGSEPILKQLKDEDWVTLVHM